MFLNTNLNFEVYEVLIFVPLPGEDGQQPVFLLVSKDLSNIFPKAQREAVLV